jgi:hypothetical protein
VSAPELKVVEGRNLDVREGTILKDPRKDCRWIVTGVERSGCWVADYPTPSGQTAIIFLWANVNRLIVEGHLAERGGAA